MQRLRQHLRLTGRGDAIVEAGAGFARRARDDTPAIERQQVMAPRRKDDRPCARVVPRQVQVHDLATLRLDRQTHAEWLQQRRRPRTRGDDNTVRRDRRIAHA